MAARRLEKRPDKVEANVTIVSDIRTLYASEKELEFLLETMTSEHVTRVLEVGSKDGRMLLRWKEILPRGARVCSIDLPGGAWGSSDSDIRLNAVISHLRSQGLDSHVHFGNSQDDKAINWARKLGPYDLVFIDADHDARAVQRDWQNYSPMARMVAFHDISPKVSGGKVGEFYQKMIKTEGLVHKELIENDTTPGIGIVWT